MKRKRNDDGDSNDIPSAKRVKELEGSFNDFKISEPLLKGLNELGVITPSEIQKKALPYVQNGLDVIVQSKNGTGKTIIFSVVAVQKIDLSISQVQSIIIVPTREIAIQVHSVIESVSKYITDPGKVTSRFFIGGTKWEDDFNALKKGTQILICSVGRLKKLLEKDKIKTDYLKLVVLDEADKLFSFQLKNQTEVVLDTLINTKKGRGGSQKRVQVLAFSATFPKSQRREVEKYMVKPEFLSVVGVRNLEVDNVLEFYITLPQQVRQPGNVEQQHPIVQNYQTKKRKLLEVLNLLDPHIHQVIIFTSTTLSCENLSSCLQDNHFLSSHLTSRLSQDDRSRIIEEFRSFKIRILVTTQLLSRGVDFSRVNMVINFVIPEDSNEYIHIMGRAGRFGRVGLFLNFVVSENEFRRLMYARRLCSEDKPIRTFPQTLHPSLFVPKFTSKEDEEKLKVFVKKRSEKCKEKGAVVINNANFLTRNFNRRKNNNNKKRNNINNNNNRMIQQNDTSIQLVPPPPFLGDNNNNDNNNDQVNRKKRRRRRRNRKKKKKRKKRGRKKRSPKKILNGEEEEEDEDEEKIIESSNNTILPPPPPLQQQQPLPPPPPTTTTTITLTTKDEDEDEVEEEIDDDDNNEMNSLIFLSEKKSDDDGVVIVEKEQESTSFKHQLSTNFGIFSSFLEDMK